MVGIRTSSVAVVESCDKVEFEDGNTMYSNGVKFAEATPSLYGTFWSKEPHEVGSEVHAYICLEFKNKKPTGKFVVRFSQ